MQSLQWCILWMLWLYQSSQSHQAWLSLEMVKSSKLLCCYHCTAWLHAHTNTQQWKSPRNSLMRAFAWWTASARWDSSNTSQLNTSILALSDYDIERVEVQVYVTHTHTHTRTDTHTRTHTHTHTHLSDSSFLSELHVPLQWYMQLLKGCGHTHIYMWQTDRQTDRQTHTH